MDKETETITTLDLDKLRESNPAEYERIWRGASRHKGGLVTRDEMNEWFELMKAADVVLADQFQKLYDIWDWYKEGRGKSLSEPEAGLVYKRAQLRLTAGLGLSEEERRDRLGFFYEDLFEMERQMLSVGITRYKLNGLDARAQYLVDMAKGIIPYKAGKPKVAVEQPDLQPDPGGLGLSGVLREDKISRVANRPQDPLYTERGFEDDFLE